MSADENGAETLTAELPAQPIPGRAPVPPPPPPHIGGSASTPQGTAPVARTGLDRLRDVAAEVKGDTDDDHIDLPIPGWGGQLGARYIVPEFDDMRDVEIRVFSEPVSNSRRELNLFIDELILSCESMLIRDEDGEWEPLRDGQERVVRWDKRLATALDVEAEEAREVVLGVFAEKSSRKRAPYLVGDHHDAVRAFIRSETAAPLSEGPLGE